MLSKQKALNLWLSLASKRLCLCPHATETILFLSATFMFLFSSQAELRLAVVAVLFIWDGLKQVLLNDSLSHTHICDSFNDKNAPCD